MACASTASRTARSSCTRAARSRSPPSCRLRPVTTSRWPTPRASAVSRWPSTKKARATPAIIPAHAQTRRDSSIGTLHGVEVAPAERGRLRRPGRCAWRAQPAGIETHVEESEHRSEGTRPPEEQPPRSPAGGEGPPPEEQLPRSAAGNEPATMIPSRERRRWGVERVLMRLVATGGIVGIGVLLGAVLVSQDVAGWIVGLVVALTSVALAAVLWSSRQV